MARKSKPPATRHRKPPVETHLGPEARKVHPKLRMIANGSSRVNVLRSERCGSIVPTKRSPKLDEKRLIATHPDVPILKRQLKPDEVRGKQKRLPPDIDASVFIETTDLGDAKAGQIKVGREWIGKGNIMTMRVSLAELPALARSPSVNYVELGQPLRAPAPRIDQRRPARPSPKRWTFSDAKAYRLARDNVLIGLIDVQGFDFAHEEFLNPDGTTRFVAIWDQGGDGKAHPSPKRNGFVTCDFDYGSELAASDLNAAIGASEKIHVPAPEIEPQSQMVPGSHGTHVASIAAGRSGVCKGAAIAGVLIALPDKDRDRRSSFFDSTRIVHAVDYLIDLGAKLHRRVSINISLGTNGHAHDASSVISRWIDSTLGVPGRSVAVAAGNAGQERAEFPGDRGFVMGRIHTSGKIPASGLTTDIDWVIEGNGRADVSENEMEIWYGAQDRFAVWLRPPGPPESTPWVGPVKPGEFLENHLLDDKHGGTFVSIYNDLYHPANGANLVGIYLSPFFAESGPVGIMAGTWTVRLEGIDVRSGDYHAWIERDDPRPIGRRGTQELWNFPSCFSERSNVDNTSVSSLACGNWVISVANLDEHRERAHITSSQGPTRDNRCKPEVAAPGTDIVAAKGFSSRDDAWIAMTGTSMASPYVAGVAGLMLAVNEKLTAAQILGIMQRTSRPIAGASFTWANDTGYGLIDADACLREAVAILTRVDLNAREKN